LPKCPTNRRISNLFASLSVFQDETLALHRAAIADLPIGIDPMVEASDLMDIEAVYLDTGGEFLVGLLGGEVVAVGGFKLRGHGVAELKRMRVAKELQGQGIGSRLLAELERRARDCGITQLTLETAKARPLTLEFIKSMVMRSPAPDIMETQ
jgi:GNAT superfamily N-acetyltransferase